MVREGDFLKKILPPGSWVSSEDLVNNLVKTPAVECFVKERRGFYVVLEGIDGAGKTVLSDMLRNELVKRGFECIVVREPWTSEVKKLLSEGDLNPIVEAYLFAADRLYMHYKVLSRHLERNCVVVGDRSFIASIAYQSSRGAPEELVVSINSFALKPDLVILLDLPVKEALDRIRGCKRQLKRLEDEELLEKIRLKYLEIAGSGLYNMVVVDASRSLSEVFSEVLSIVLKSIPERIKAYRASRSSV